MKVRNESEVAQSCPTRSDPWTAAYQAPPSMGFSRQEYWSGVPLPSPQQRNRNCILKMEVLELKSTIPEIANPLNLGLRANGVGEESVDVNI